MSIHGLYHAVPDKLVHHSTARDRRAWNFWFTVLWIFPGGLIWFVLRNDLWFVGFLSIWALWISHWTAFAAETPTEDQSDAIDAAAEKRHEEQLVFMLEVLARIEAMQAQKAALHLDNRRLILGLYEAVDADAPDLDPPPSLATP